MKRITLSVLRDYALGIFVAVLILLVMRAAVGILVELNRRLAPSIPWYVVGLVTLLVVLLAWAIVGRDQKVVSTQTVKWLWKVTIVASGIACLLSIQLALLSIASPKFRAIPAFALGSWSEKALLTFAAIPAYFAVIEEVLFRGYLQRKLLANLEPIAAVVLAAMPFVALHAFRTEFAYLWPFYIALALVCGWAAYAVGLLAAISIHGIYNIAINTSLLVVGSFGFAHPDVGRSFLLLVTSMVLVLMFAWASYRVCKTKRAGAAR